MPRSNQITEEYIRSLLNSTANVILVLAFPIAAFADFNGTTGLDFGCADRLVSSNINAIYN